MLGRTEITIPWLAMGFPFFLPFPSGVFGRW